jgi:hypothetical protein
MTGALRNVGENLAATVICAPILDPLAGQTPDPLLEAFKELVTQLPGFRTTLFVACHNDTLNQQRAVENDLIAESAVLSPSSPCRTPQMVGDLGADD